MKKRPSRNTGIPDSCSAVTVKFAVHSISGGISASPIGTPSTRKPKGNMIAFATSRPRIAITVAQMVPTNASCFTTRTSPASATSQIAPAQPSSTRPNASGVGESAARACRRCQISTSTMGTIRKPWAKVSERAQMATMDSTVGQWIARTATSAPTMSGSASLQPGSAAARGSAAETAVTVGSACVLMLCSPERGQVAAAVPLPRAADAHDRCARSTRRAAPGGRTKYSQPGCGRVQVGPCHRPARGP